MTGKKIKRIPYGVANYALLVQENFYYVDKTAFLPVVEDAGNYLFFIRPRRFGKTLFLSVMEAYRETGIFNLDLDRYADLMTGMAYDGRWRPLLEFITGRMKESMSLRDLITGEKSIQAFLNVYLGLSDLFIIHMEREMNKGYADSVMEPFLARHEGIKYSYILEIKYIKAGASPDDEKVRQLKTQAEDQLKSCSIDVKFGKTIAKTDLIKIVLVFSGHELIDMFAVNE